MKKLLLSALLLLGSWAAFADEGMWMVQALNRAIESNMKSKGCKLSAKEIYNADAPGSSLCDAIVALDFECTGSIISDNGLVITNHHCAYSDVFSLSTSEHNYLEDGYWALLQKDEIPIPGKHMLFLRKAIDVTDEVNTLIEELKASGQPYGSRRLSTLMERRYREEGASASLESMWGGSKYYMCIYDVYSDIRLVAAPPVSIAAFGGDIDNWDWPQHKCDFAMYRIYTGADGKPAEYSEQNIPLKPRKKLEISLDGYKEGDFTMVLGFPGITHRYNSSAKVAFEQDVTLPISNRVRGLNMAVINKWMNEDPDIRLKYSDRYFMLSNVQELNEGTVACYKRFGVVDEKKELENRLMGEEKALLDSIYKTYNDIRDVRRSEEYYKECLVRGTKLYILALRMSSNSANASNGMKEIYDAVDLRVERDIFRCSIEEYFNNVEDCYLGEYQKELKACYGKDYDAMCTALWDKSFLTDMGKVEEYINGKINYKEDPLYRFFTDVKITSFHDAEAKASPNSITALNREYIRALYRIREKNGIAQYPDANSTLRLTYGTVGKLKPRDGVVMDWKSSSRGILEKYRPDQYEYTLKGEWKDLLENNAYCKKYNWHGEVDFISDNDITGGNSGSPVMDAKGRLIGLAFDGNTESLAGDSSFTRDYSKCINVDIRYVLFCLEHYGHMDRIISELGL